ncbi:hypothetical protein Y1Q_0022614 [Alligator mississippiensis]|uniref:Uncharacterized protein n=1 Tax=Alligator mississippiensis TaxID=8496 RepID=A0A151NRF2_ALLMI|nr:hypothetical protein Y1Q_0022614 [Alligator mississippiensis]
MISDMQLGTADSQGPLHTGAPIMTLAAPICQAKQAPSHPGVSAYHSPSRCEAHDGCPLSEAGKQRAGEAMQRAQGESGERDHEPEASLGAAQDE